MGISTGSKEEEAYRQLVITTLNLWNSLGIDKGMVLKILGEELKADKSLDIFITDIKTEYTVLESYRDNEKNVWNETDGYKVVFVLNNDIDCEIRISANECNGCREQIKAYIRNKIGGIK